MASLSHSVYMFVGTKEDCNIPVSKDTLLRVNPGALKYEAGVPPIDHNVCYFNLYNINTKWYDNYYTLLHRTPPTPLPSLSFKFHLLSFLRSVQDYKIHMDMEIVIFLESRGETNLEVYSNHMVQYSI